MKERTKERKKEKQKETQIGRKKKEKKKRKKDNKQQINKVKPDSRTVQKLERLPNHSRICDSTLNGFSEAEGTADHILLY